MIIGLALASVTMLPGLVQQDAFATGYVASGTSDFTGSLIDLIRETGGKITH